MPEPVAAALANTTHAKTNDLHDFSKRFSWQVLSPLFNPQDKWTLCELAGRQGDNQTLRRTFPRDLRFAAQQLDRLDTNNCFAALLRFRPPLRTNRTGTTAPGRRSSAPPTRACRQLPALRSADRRSRSATDANATGVAGMSRCWPLPEIATASPAFKDCCPAVTSPWKTWTSAISPVTSRPNAVPRSTTLTCGVSTLNPPRLHRHLRAQPAAPAESLAGGNQLQFHRAFEQDPCAVEELPTVPARISTATSPAPSAPTLYVLAGSLHCTSTAAQYRYGRRSSARQTASDAARDGPPLPTPDTRRCSAPTMPRPAGTR